MVEHIDDSGHTPTRSDRIRLVVGECQRRWSQGESVSDQSIIDTHPELMPELAEELRLLRLVQQARQKAEEGSAQLGQTDASENEGTHSPGRCPSQNLLGCYQILHEIGRGGMGVVYRARHLHMDRVVALKVVSDRARLSADAVARFRREVRTLAKMSHPNIVTAYDSGQQSGVLYLVMEWVEGKNLQAVVDLGGPLAPRRAVDFIIQAAEALDYAHRRGVVHRDVKPSNLMLDEHGTVKVLDMGLARLHQHSSESTDGSDLELTQSRQLMGTYGYLAPEQALDARKADHRADIYSLGCTLHFLLTGKPPYSGASALERLIVEREAPTLEPIHVEGVAPTLNPTFQRMVARSPDDRYQSMREVIEQLRGAEEAHVTTQVGNKSTMPRQPRPSRLPLRRSTVLGTLLVLLTTAIGVIALTGKKLVVRTDGPLTTALVNKLGIMVRNRATHLEHRCGVGRTTLNPGDYDILVKKSPVGLNFSSTRISIRRLRQWTLYVTLQPQELSDVEFERVVEELQRLNPEYDGKHAVYKREGQDVILRFSPLDPGLTPPRDKILPLRDITPLAGVCLTKLYLDHTEVDDLRPLRHMSLHFLSLNYTNVDDLSPISQVPLTDLYLTGTRVASLREIERMPLERISIVETQVSDLTPLRGMPLSEIYCSEDLGKRHADVLRSIATLESINEMPQADFWKSVH